MKNEIYILFAILFATPLIAAQTPLENKLISEGYENVILGSSSSSIFIAVENARFRYSAAGVVKALGWTSALMPNETQRIFFVNMKYGIPMLSLKSKTIEQKGKIKLPRMVPSSTWHDVATLLRAIQAENSSRLKTDLIFHPDVQAKLGDYDNPIALQLNVVPELRTLLAKGLILSTSMVIPLYNELESWGNYVRLGPSALYAFRRLESFFVYGTAGYFKGNRYGALAGLRTYFFGERLAVDGRVGLSGYGLMDKGRFQYSNIDALSYSLMATAYFPDTQLFCSIGGHRFLYRDYGIELNVYRFFHDFRFGFWTQFADGEFNGGFTFSLPMPPRQYTVRKKFRIRPASYFGWKYYGKRTLLSGQHFRADEFFDELFMRYNSAYLYSKLSVFKP